MLIQRWAGGVGVEFRGSCSDVYGRVLVESVMEIWGWFSGVCDGFFNAFDWWMRGIVWKY